MTPDTKARLVIDQKIVQAGWVVQDRKVLNLGAAQGVAVRLIEATRRVIRFTDNADPGDESASERIARIRAEPAVQASAGKSRGRRAQEAA